MVIKQVFLDEKGRKELKKGINQISDAVASTLGPCGQTVLLESENHVGGVTVTKDGVTVAKNINLYNPVQNLAVQLVREAAAKTAISAGDGTTTSIVLTRGIIDAYDNVVSNFNKTQVLRSINSICEEMVAKLEKMSKPVKGKMLLDVATISANNDPVIGKLISDVYSEVNHVTVENSKTTKTYSEVIKGIRINRGWSSKYFINDHKKSECMFEDAYVLMTDQEISNLSNIENIIKHVLSENKPLLIIGELSPQVLATLNMNVVQGKIKVCNIIPPNFGYRKSDMMTDIAVAIDSHYYSEGTGDNLALCSVEGLGRVKKVIVGQDQTIIIPYTEDNEALKHHVNELEASKELETLDVNVDFINERIANISGGIGVIHVGANSDIEQKELRDRVDDAVLAVKAAIEDGILPGGGIGLLDAMRYIRPGKDNDYDIAVGIMNSAISEPFKTICSNAGLNWMDCAEPLIEKSKNGFGFDVKNEKYGDMIKMGIIDPAKVTKTALKNAVSVATTILSTNAIITNVRENESVE